jgi:VWFA-related protein
MIRAMKSLALLAGLIAALAQTSASNPQLFTLLVTNGAGQYVPNLQAKDFILEEDGVPQAIDTFSADPSLPISLGILIDKSTSMRLPVAVQGREPVSAALLAADGAARVVVHLTKEQDEYLFMVFDEKMDVKQSFTTDKKKVTDLLNKNTIVGGSTHLYKAVGDALKEVAKKAKNRKRAMIVITDVHDTSGDKIDELQSIIRAQEIPVYTFGMRWDAWGVPGEAAETAQAPYEEEILRMIGNESGGFSTVVDIPDLLSDYTVNRMIDFVQRIGVEVRGQYSMSYRSQKPGPPTSKVVRVRAVDPALRIQLRREDPPRR